MDPRLGRLINFFLLRCAAAVALSGGVDSTLTLYAAGLALGRRALGVHVRSELVSAAALCRTAEAAAFLTKSTGVRVVSRSLTLLDEPGVRTNPPDRCRFCKGRMLEAVRRTAAEGLSPEGLGPGADVCDGTNASDDPARPGRRALAEAGALSPLAACGLTKRDVRELAGALGLPNAAAPSDSCLATRIPAGCELTRKRLAAVEGVEAAAARCGLTDLRCRLVPGAEGDAALLLVRPEEAESAQACTEKLAAAARGLGFAGFRLGERR